MNNQELAHAWANQTKQSAKGSNMFFEGDTIYSYGYHFPIATIHNNDKTGKMILFTSKDYSVTTSKHKTYVRRAINGLYVTVPIVRSQFANTEINHTFNMDYLIEMINKNLELAKRAIKYGNSYLNIVDKIGRDFDVYTAYFKPKMTKEQKRIKKLIENKELIPQELRDHAQASLLKAQEKARLNEIKRVELQREKLLLWKAGEDIRIYFEETCLRVKDGFVETSKGARVTLEAGKTAYKALKAGTLSAGYNIEGYTVISVNGNLKIGCHVIPMAEIERISNQLV